MSAITDTRDQLRAKYAKLDSRERQMVIVIGGLLAFLVVWLLLVRPAWKTLDEAPALRAQADAQLLQMQAISNEAKQLRALPPVAAVGGRASAEVGHGRPRRQGQDLGAGRARDAVGHRHQR